jgi:plasmid maintenance system killer protein
VEISFATRRLEKTFNSDRELLKIFGPRRAPLIRRRLDQLRAADHLAVMRTLPGRCHELIGNRRGTLSIDLDGPYRLLFEPAEDPPPAKPDGGLAWDQVTTIRILGVEDTHG